jgi:hypothetical protein
MALGAVAVFTEPGRDALQVRATDESREIRT